MRETKQSQELDFSAKKPGQTRNRVYSREILYIKEAKNLSEYVQQNTALRGRGYLALRQDKCFYYGREDFLGDEIE